MFDWSQHMGISMNRDKNKQQYRAYIPRYLVKVVRLDKQASTLKEMLSNFHPKTEPKNEKNDL